MWIWETLHICSGGRVFEIDGVWGTQFALYIPVSIPCSRKVSDLLPFDPSTTNFDFTARPATIQVPTRRRKRVYDLVMAGRTRSSSWVKAQHQGTGHQTSHICHSLHFHRTSPKHNVQVYVVAPLKFLVPSPPISPADPALACEYSLSRLEARRWTENSGNRSTPLHIWRLKDGTNMFPYARKITPIHESSHPAHGQAGLFAAQHLESGTMIIPYYGVVHTSLPPHCSGHDCSDYDLWLDRDANIAVDAAQAGNEARFVNDYRGVDSRPNAEFKECWDARTGQKCMAVFVLPAGKNSAGGIAKGHEILVSYGKGFWSKRRDERESESGQEAALKAQ
ncbi:hypothetical protein GGR57DRAFT_380995 [Xylariaceae sp. FL1272]|nr:hypothetical protein GGR57DRAFT_380995 [Xylariaceae sp. FL1272]